MKSKLLGYQYRKLMIEFISLRIQELLQFINVNKYLLKLNIKILKSKEELKCVAFEYQNESFHF